MKHFKAYSDYYELLYRDKNYAEEATYVDNMLKNYGVSGQDILELGSGTGIHGRLLGQLGYQVKGLELSEDMLSHAELTDNFNCEQGDIRHVSLGRQFDAVVSLFHVISYQTENDDLAAVFHKTAEHLRPGGLFLFDVWYTPAVCDQKPEVRVKRLVDGDLHITRIAEPVNHPNQNRVDVNYTIIVEDTSKESATTFTELHPMRHFSLPEIDLLASHYGFRRLCQEELLTKAAPSEETWAICVLLERI